MSTLAERVGALRPTAVNAILADVREVAAAGTPVVSLMRGEPDLPTPPHIVEAARKALIDGRTNYPDNRGEPPLREAVAARMARDHDLAVDPGTEVLVTTGATLGVQCALLALVGPGDDVLVPDPIYDAYHSVVGLAGAGVRPVLSTITGDRFRLTVSALEAARSAAAKVLLLNTPWNPVGTVLRRDELQAIGDFVLRHGLTLVSDEIYEAIVYDGATHLSPATLSPELRARTVVVNSLSKTYAMTGWRVGYTVAPPDLTRAMFLVLQQASRGPATFVQDAAVAALAGPQDTVAAMRDEYAARRARVLEALRDIAGTRVLPPEGGFFAMVDARYVGHTSDEIRRRLLRDYGVVVAHGSAYGAEGEGMLRVSFASGGETLTEGLARLRRGLSSL
jgi:aspartate/methionine/tyrosine aminotransferase